MRGLKSTSVGLDAAKVKPAKISNCCTSLSNCFGRYVSSQCARSQEWKMSCQTPKQPATPTEHISVRGHRPSDVAVHTDTRICRAGTPPSAPQPQFGPRRTDRSNSLRLTADKRGAINTRASGEEAGMEIKIITDAIRNALHLWA